MRRKSIILCLLSNLIFSLCSNIDFKQSNVNLESKYEDLIYYTNAPMSREEYGTIDDYSLDSYEPSKIIRRNNVKTQIDLGHIGPIGPIGPIDPRPPFTPVTPENPLPTIYNGALQVPYFNQKKFVKNYYENLTSNLPYNNVGNCGYTAISLLLQYYDTYWNYNFIDNKYNVNNCVLDSKSDESFVSPGVKDIYYEIWTSENPKVPETDPNYKEKKAEATRKYIINMMNSGSFMGYLYSIGVELDFIKLDSIDVGTGVSFNVVKGVLTKYIEKNEYINEYVSVSAKNLKDFNNNENDLRNAVIAKLKKGQPVILGGGTKSGGGHDTVAYYYDEENDIIYGHSGWKNSSTTSHALSFHNLDDMFEYYADFFYIEVISGLNHTHNKYFKIYNSSTTYNYYCNCELDSHICGFYDFSYGDKNYHVHQCLCEFKYVLHEFERVTTDTKKCKYCRMMISEPSKEN